MKKLVLWEKAAFQCMQSIAEKCTPAILCLLHLASFAMLFFQKNSKIANCFLLLEFFCFFALLILHYRVLRPVWLLCLLGLNMIFLPITLYTRGGYGSALVYSGVVIALLVFNQTTISRRTHSTMHWITAILLTYLLGMGEWSRVDNVYWIWDRISFNSNLYGILALACMLHWVCAFDQMRIKTPYRLLGQLCGLLLGVSYIISSSCRSALMAIAFWVLLLMLVRKPFSPKLRWPMLSLLAVACLAFAVIYVVMCQRIENIVIFDKFLFSGRENIWIEALSLLKENFLLGISKTKWRPSMHNTVLQLWYSLGLIPTITLIVLFGYGCKASSQAHVSKMTQIAFIGCLPVMFLESFLMDPYLYVFFLSFLLANVRTETRKELQ